MTTYDIPAAPISASVYPEARAASLSIFWRAATPYAAGLLVGLQDVDLVQIAGTALRLYDVLSAAVVFASMHTLLRRPFSKSHRSYLVWWIASLVSVVHGVVTFGLPVVVGVLFALRPIQYLLVGAALTNYISSKRDWQRFAWTAFGLMGVSLVVDLLNTPGGAGGRFGWSYGGPFELASVAACLGVISVWRFRLLSLGACSFILVMLSAARITISVVVVIVAILLVRYALRRPEVVLLGLIAVGVLLAVLFSTPSFSGFGGSAFDRFRDTGILDEVATSARLAENIGYPANYTEVEPRTVEAVSHRLPPTGYDNSTLLRFTRWRLLTEAQHSSSLSMFFGLGAGSGTAAVDGYYVRVLVETGWLGLLAYAGFVVTALRVAYRVDRAVATALVILFCSALFVDVLVASKAMSLLWILLSRYR